MVLVGTEVKTLREGKGSLREAYAEIRLGEAWLVNCHIPEYLPGGYRNHDPLRKRKLLLKRREIERLLVQTQQKGMTIVPTKIYFRDGIAKCELAVAQGKKFHDRRESEKQKEAKREASEAMFPLAPALNTRNEREHMQIQLETQPYSSIRPTRSSLMFSTRKKIKSKEFSADIDHAMNGRLAALVASRRNHRQSARTRRCVHFPEGLDAKRLLLVGAGKPEKFSQCRPAQNRRHRAPLSEIARREEIRLPRARRRTRPRSSASRHRRPRSSPISNPTNIRPKKRRARNRVRPRSPVSTLIRERISPKPSNMAA